MQGYRAAWDRLFEDVAHDVRALHHTSLSLGTLVPYDRRAMLDFTADLVERYKFGWVNEDLGFWSLDGQPIPYPLPPVLDARAIAPAARAVRECQAALPVPLVVEFPGFSDDASVTLGRMHAYDFFRLLAEETDAPVTLDIGHLLSYQWLLGRRGEDLFGEFDRLPLAHGFEIHLAGSSIVGDRFVDAHHGRLLDIQLECLRRLLPLCPNVRAVTFEDPAITADGALDEGSRESIARLREVVGAWASGEAQTEAPRVMRPPELVAEREALIDLAPLERAFARRVTGRAGEEVLPEPLAALLDNALPPSMAGLSELVAGRLATRTHRGLGTLADRFPTAVSAWRVRCPADGDLSALSAAFLASPEATMWREGPAERDGASLEEAFAAFADRLALGDPVPREDEYLGALVRAIALSPTPAFRIPHVIRSAPSGFYAMTTLGTVPVLHAFVSGRYLRGPITPLLAELLDGVPPADVAQRRGLDPRAVDGALAELSRLGLLAT